MAKCIKCKQKKAKRFCKALGGEICSLCCGLLRNKEIHCPPGCSFLAQHRPYEEKRIIKKKTRSSPRPEPGRKDLLQDERMAWLALHIEAPLKEYGERNSLFSDKEAILALEYAREHLDKGQSLVIFPQRDGKPKNEIGEAILQSLANCRYQRNIILSDGSEVYKNEEKLQCLERVIFGAKSWIGENLEGRNYIQNLIEQFAKIQELSRQKRIITPT